MITMMTVTFSARPVRAPSGQKNQKHWFR